VKNTSRKLSPKARSRARSRKTDPSRSRAQGVQAPQHRDIDLPRIFVQVPPPPGRYGHRFAQARIVLRRRVYRYLVWKENGRKRMLYLGKIKISALLPAISAADQAPAAARDEGGQE
jgi:hypothetical protein